MAEGKQAEWRELCAAAAKESDPERLASLVDQIIQAIDGQLATARHQTYRSSDNATPVSSPLATLCSDRARLANAGKT